MSMQPPDRDGVHRLARPFLWLNRRFAKDVISLGVVLIAMILLTVDFFISRHGVNALSGRPGFYAVFGFLAFGVIVLAGWPLRAWLTRSPDYYGEPEDGDV